MNAEHLNGHHLNGQHLNPLNGLHVNGQIRSGTYQDIALKPQSASAPLWEEDHDVRLNAVSFLNPKILDELAGGYRKAASYDIFDARPLPIPDDDAAYARGLIRRWRKETSAGPANKRPRVTHPQWLSLPGSSLYTAYPFGLRPGGAMHLRLSCAWEKLPVADSGITIDAITGRVDVRSPAYDAVNYHTLALYRAPVRNLASGLGMKSHAMQWLSVARSLEIWMKTNMADELVLGALTYPERFGCVVD